VSLVLRGRSDWPSAAMPYWGSRQRPSAILSGSSVLVWPVTDVSEGRVNTECAVPVAATEGLDTLQ
jgi:hypothetical protein